MARTKRQPAAEPPLPTEDAQHNAEKKLVAMLGYSFAQARQFLEMCDAGQVARVAEVRDGQALQELLASLPPIKRPDRKRAGRVHSDATDTRKDD